MMPALGLHRSADRRGRPPGRREAAVTSDQVLFGIGLTVLLAVGSQVLASQLRIPALIVLLPVGFLAGALTQDINPNRILGTAFQPLVQLAVAVILYDAGLSLDVRRLIRRPRQVVVRLIVLGIPSPGRSPRWRPGRCSTCPRALR